MLGIYKQLAKEDPQRNLECASTLVLIAEVTSDRERALMQLGSALRTYQGLLGCKHVEVGTPNQS